MKQDKTVPIHARLPQSDVETVDRVASEQPIPITRSKMVALIVREWVRQQRSPRKKSK